MKDYLFIERPYKEVTDVENGIMILSENDNYTWFDRDIDYLENNLDYIDDELIVDLLINQQLTENILIKLLDKDNISQYKLDLICNFQSLSEYIMKKYSDKLNFNILAYVNNNDENFVTKYIEHIDIMSLILLYGFIPTEQFILSNISLFDKFYSHGIRGWDILSSVIELDISFIKKLKNKLNWDVISAKREQDIFQISFIREFQECINWKLFSEYSIAAHFDVDEYEDIILEFKDKIDWNEISSIPLPISVLIECKDKVDWNKFSDNISWFIHKGYYGYDILEKFKKYLNLKKIKNELYKNIKLYDKNEVEEILNFIN